MNFPKKAGFLSPALTGQSQAEAGVTRRRWTKPDTNPSILRLPFGDPLESEPEEPPSTLTLPRAEQGNGRSRQCGAVATGWQQCFSRRGRLPKPSEADPEPGSPANTGFVCKIGGHPHFLWVLKPLSLLLYPTFLSQANRKRSDSIFHPPGGT